jgi:hypothetical protein
MKYGNVYDTATTPGPYGSKQSVFKGGDQTPSPNLVRTFMQQAHQTPMRGGEGGLHLAQRLHDNFASSDIKLPMKGHLEDSPPVSRLESDQKCSSSCSCAKGDYWRQHIG